MNRNQKIALGCGGAGCLGIILILVVCVILGVAGYITVPGISSNRNTNDNANANANENSNVNSNANRESSTSSSVSNDDKHKLFQAAAVAKDSDLMRKVWEKLGLLNSDGSPNADYEPFFKEHISWIFKNTKFIQSINTQEKARAYVDEHIDD